MKVYITNTEAVWQEFGFEVELPDDTPHDQVAELALEKYHEGDAEMTWGPDTEGNVEGVDQEHEVTGYDVGEKHVSFEEEA